MLNTDPIPTPNARLKDAANWRYLLKEFYEMYRHLPSGGSDRIRAHLRNAREAISRVQKANPEMSFDPPCNLPVTDHLGRALDEGRQDRMAPVVRTLERVAPELSWRYGYEKVPRGLARSYGYAEIAGPSGPIVTDEIILGVVLFAPDCTYPAHAHKGITESYICLSGAVSENHQGVYAAGSLIHNPPEHLHRITVGRDEPALLAYAWCGAREDLAGQKMNFSRPRGPKA